MDKYNSNFARFQADIFRDKPRSPKPIFEIKKIDQPYLVIFYTLAWGINPNLLGMGRAKAGYQRMITDLSRRFREAANITTQG
jgi:hypothetical protein